jgi:regulator of protease activity HflC (stomatin/prohibitin superfamily)
MFAVKTLLEVVSVLLFGFAAGVVGYDVYLAIQFQRLMSSGESGAVAQPDARRPTRPAMRWPLAAKLIGCALGFALLASSLELVPEGAGGIRISQISGVRPGTLYPGVHLVVPMVQRVAVYDLRDHVFSTAAAAEAGGKEAVSTEGGTKNEVLTVQAKEGLTLGLAITVRYRLDPQKLSYIHANLAQPVDTEIVEPVVSTAFRDLAPNYVVREIFSTSRDQFRDKATQTITQRLAPDGIIVKEVLLRDVQLPAEFAKGLEGLLLKEQESDRMAVETTIQEKQVRIAELEAEAEKARQVKRAEATAASQVIAAKAESDAMQYTLPLKQKQIEQSRLEAQARKEATVQNAEAAAESKTIDSKAEAERRKLLTAADADGIRLTASADAERMQQEAAVLKQNPMLIQKIIAERLSDKLQIIMVPTDGRNFFASDVLRSAFAGTQNSADPDEPNPDVPAPARKPIQAYKNK